MNQIDPERYGISFSVKQCRNFGLDSTETLNWLLAQGWRRFRLMSYWNEHQKQPATTDFSNLDKQIELITKAGGVISLCLGARQPRWPENHWPEWVWQAEKQQRSQELLKYIETVVKRYRDNPAIVSYQLENEALLKKFGRRAEVDRRRLRHEFALIKRLDPQKPVIMSTSNAWGVPLRRPKPDVVGFSYYFVVHGKRGYTRTLHSAGFHRLRKNIIALLRRPVFIHELQLEPWGSKAIWEMSRSEQAVSMSLEQIRHNLRQARRVGAWPIDLWGAEWWYWRFKHGDESVWKTVRQNLITN